MGQQNDLPLGDGVTFEAIEDGTKLCFFETVGGFRSTHLRQLADQLDRENEIFEREQRAWFDGYDQGKTDTIAEYLAVQYGASPIYIHTGLQNCVCDDAISVDDDTFDGECRLLEVMDVEWNPVVNLIEWGYSPTPEPVNFQGLNQNPRTPSPLVDLPPASKEDPNLSEAVLVRLGDRDGLWFDCYNYGKKSWVYGGSSDNVLEWWPLPAEGTGTPTGIIKTEG